MNSLTKAIVLALSVLVHLALIALLILQIVNTEPSTNSAVQAMQVSLWDPHALEARSIKPIEKIVETPEPEITKPAVTEKTGQPVHQQSKPETIIKRANTEQPNNKEITDKPKNEANDNKASVEKTIPINKPNKNELKKEIEKETKKEIKNEHKESNISKTSHASEKKNNNEAEINPGQQEDRIAQEMLLAKAEQEIANIKNRQHQKSKKATLDTSEQITSNKQRADDELKDLNTQRTNQDNSEYIEIIRKKIRYNIQLNNIKYTGNPEAEIIIDLLPSGDVIMPVRIVKSSGFPDLDNAVMRSIYKSSPFPKPKNMEQRHIKIIYKPM